MPELTDPPSLRERIIADSKPYLSPEPAEDEFTLSEYMQWNNIEDRSTAERAIKRQIADGLYTVRKGKLNGASVNVYKES